MSLARIGTEAGSSQCVNSSMNEFNEQSVYSRIADEQLLDDSRQASDHLVAEGVYSIKNVGRQLESASHRILR